jgi:hypothetical protein
MAPTRARADVEADKLPDEAGDEDQGARTAAAAEPRPRQIDDPAFVKRHGLTEEYVEAVRRGEIPDPPYLEPDNDETELHFAGGSWQITRKGMAPGESTAISR